MPSEGCNRRVLSCHWVQTELFLTGNTHVKDLGSSILLKYTLPPAGDNTELLSAVEPRILFQARTIANPAQMNTDQVEKEIAEIYLNPGHHKEKNTKFHTNPSISRQISPTMG